VRVPDRPGIASEIFGKIAEKNIVVDMIIQNVGENRKTDISFTVPKSEAKQAVKISKEIIKIIGADEVLLDADIAKVSIIGVGMKSHSGVAAKMFNALAEEKINIKMISTSEIRISCVIDRKHTRRAANLLHETFNLGKKKT